MSRVRNHRMKMSREGIALTGILLLLFLGMAFYLVIAMAFVIGMPNINYFQMSLDHAIGDAIYNYEKKGNNIWSVSDICENPLDWDDSYKYIGIRDKELILNQRNPTIVDCLLSGHMPGEFCEENIILELITHCSQVVIHDYMADSEITSSAIRKFVENPCFGLDLVNHIYGLRHFHSVRESYSTVTDSGETFDKKRCTEIRNKWNFVLNIIIIDDSGSVSRLISLDNWGIGLFSLDSSDE